MPLNCIRREGKQMKIFLGISEISGMMASMNDAFRKLGHNSYFANFYIHPFNYDQEQKESWFVKKIRAIYYEKILTRQKGSIVRSLYSTYSKLLRVIYFLQCLFKYDAFIFIYGLSFFTFIPRLRYLDIKLLKLFKKTVVYWYVGSDSRPPYIDGTYLYTSLSMSEIAIKSKNKKEQVNTIEHLADYIIDYPSNSYFREKPFLNYFLTGIPTKIRPYNSCVENRVPRILHCPSNPIPKGTPAIRAALNELKIEGYEFEYIEIVNRPHDEVIQELARCDFVIDQVYSDTPCGGLVTEAAQFKKPSIVCGYFAEKISNVLKPEEIPVSYFCLPNDLKDAIIKLITDVPYRKDLGERAYRFIQERWNATMTAQNLLRILHHDVPKEWWYNPYDSDYLFGFGLSEDALRQKLNSFVQECGWDALLLQDKPKLLEAYRNLLNLKESS